MLLLLILISLNTTFLTAFNGDTFKETQKKNVKGIQSLALYYHSFSSEFFKKSASGYRNHRSFDRPKNTFESPILPLSPDEYRLAQLQSRLEGSSYIRSRGKVFNIMKDLLDRVNYELQQRTPNYAEVRRLNDEISFHLDIPGWWGEVTLCFRFYGDDQSDPRRYCGGVSPTCAPPNHYTSLFHDWSRGEDKGCYLSWGLFVSDNTSKWNSDTAISMTPKYTASRVFKLPENYMNKKAPDEKLPSWFKKVKLCFTHRVYCHKVLNTPVVCAELNEFTPYYYDKYGEKGCTVSMAWEVKVPEFENNGITDQNNSKISNIPAWFLASKICIRYQVIVMMPFSKTKNNFRTVCTQIGNVGYLFQDMSYYKGPFRYREHFMQWSLSNEG